MWESRDYTAGYRSRHRKTDWAGVGPADGFKQQLDYSIRLQGQRLFFDLAGKAQRAIIKTLGHAGEPPKVKTQLAPLYTDHPANFSALAAVGLTAFLEFKAWYPGQTLTRKLAAFLKDPAAHSQIPVPDPVSYKQLAQLVTETIETRLFLEDLSRFRFAATVENYRLFAAASQTLKFNSVAQMVRAVVLYGDLLPDCGRLHPLAKAILTDLANVSKTWNSRLSRLPSASLLDEGAAWAMSICRCLVKYIAPPAGAGQKSDVPPGSEPLGRREGDASAVPARHEPAEDVDSLAPLDAPGPPALLDPAGIAEQAAQSLRGQPKDPESAKRLQDFCATIQKAAGQENTCDDMRSDLLAAGLRRNPFSAGPIEGTPGDGRVIALKLCEKVCQGQHWDRALPLSDNLQEVERLRTRSLPLATSLRRVLYPSLREKPEVERFCSTGDLDPARLPLHAASSALFRRHTVRKEPDEKGRPVVLIACDASGSLNTAQMLMLKTLAGGWLLATARSQVRLLAGVYHSGTVRGGLEGPLVEWAYHLEKTPSTSRREAIRSLASLPASGTGAQSDALSLRFMVNEAKRLARGASIYLIVITDLAFNVSFHAGKTGAEEVAALFETLYDELGKRLNSTLVALGVSGPTGLEKRLDKVIRVSPAQLQDPSAVAHEIALYVAERMRAVRLDLARQGRRRR